MKIMINDNWLGKMLDYPTNICVFAWGALWRLVAAVGAGALAIGFVWLWCMAFNDAFISGHPKAATAFVVWIILSAIATIAVVATKELWYDNKYTKKLRALAADVCPTIEWNRGESK